MIDFCPACGNPSLNNQQKYMGKSDFFLPDTILNCTHCGLGIASPMPSSLELNMYYAGQYWTDPGLPFTPSYYPTTYTLALSRWKQLTPLIEKSPESAHGLKILDIGSGHSFFGTIASESSIMMGGGYYAVEPDNNYREIAKKNWKSTDCSSFFYNSLDEVCDQFDLITISHVLEHVTDPIDFIKNITTYLKPDGILFIEIPHRDDRFKKNVFPHLLFFTKDALNELLISCDLLPISIEIRGVDASSSVLSQYGKGLRHYLPKIWQRVGRYFPNSLNLIFYNWLLAPELQHPQGTWLRGIAKRKVSLFED
ncbi:class I SAM-dependent methyltransferase [Kiloniella laminariae]|uniref:Class I SAM-dependent methyltransferase n=1 Tax=Kiloniella laminariae TaxID=454162 RepID=A0ABT4LQW0_9PROT|nr:class I SAM-dependent methyltransferase [Kiloniella laminariae]MCZ4282327.1 class I SAM-dependent methyltransferase [Kiloniella laminariae]